MKKIIFIQSHNGGQLANQLWNFVSIYAYALEKKYILINPTFDQYSIHFEQFKNNALLSPNFKIKIFNKNLSWLLMRIFLFINKFIKIGESFQTGLDSEGILLPPTNNDFSPTKSILFFNGWLFRNPKGLEKFRKEITHAFRPIKEYELKINSYWERLDNRRFKIAIHIRRTDYKTLYPQYYYELDEYNYIMEMLKAYFKDKNPQFMIFSDEERKFEEFKNFSEDEIVISNNPFIVDLFLISKCDLIVGPPSTFSQFASWLGEKDLKTVDNIKTFKL